MSDIKEAISSYKVTLGRQLKADGADYYAIIDCTGSKGHHLLIYFLRPDSKKTPDNSYYTSTKTGTVILPFDLYPNYIDLLRNEKPVSMHIRTDHLEWTSIHTNEEKVGEDKGA